MNYTRGFITFLFISLISINIFPQVELSDTAYCEKSIEYLKQYCYHCEEYKEKYHCIFEKFDYLGEADNKHYYYGVYLAQNKMVRADYKHYYFIIYEGDAKESKLKPVHFFYPRYSGYEYYNFSMVKSRYGHIIHIQLVDESAGWDEGEYIIHRNGKWERLRQPSWFCASESILPENYNLDFHSSDTWIKIDLKTMSIKIPVEEGGFAIFNLTVEKDRFGIASSEYIPDIVTQKLESNTDIDTFSYCENSIDFLFGSCYSCEKGLVDTLCEVKEFKYLGEGNGKQYYYGLYREMAKNDDDFENLFFVIYESRNKQIVKPIHFLNTGEIGIDYHYVEIKNTKYGLIIHIYYDTGNGHWDEGEYIIFRKGKWEILKIPEWGCVYEWVIPEEYYFCKGSTIDLKTMTIKFAVYSHDDACCCPTKGIVTSKIIIDENGFRVISSKYYPDRTIW